MAQQTLSQYLDLAHSAIPTQNTIRTKNTQNSKYSWQDIKISTPWHDFNYQRIYQTYGNILQNVCIDRNPFPTSPPRRIHDEIGFCFNYVEIHSRVRRSLRAAFSSFTPQQLQDSGMTPIVIDVGTNAQMLSSLNPGLAMIPVHAQICTSPNRAPGVFNVSWNWDSTWRHATDGDDYIEYRQVLAQLYFHMKQHRARFGFIVTDAELVPIMANDWQGSLSVEPSVAWQARGPGRMTVLLAV